MSPMTKFLLELRRNQRIADGPPSELRIDGMPAAYTIQDQLVEQLRVEAGAAFQGYKIACTNTHAQALLNTDVPAYGRLLSSLVQTSPARYPADRFCIRVIEAEFAFRMARDVPIAKTHTRTNIKQWIGDLLPAIEIVDHRFSDWSYFDALTLIADNALHGAWVPGAPVVDWRHVSLADHEVHLEVNGRRVRTGTGSNVLGHPLEAVAWLANTLAGQGKQLRSGEFVSTGTCTDIYTANTGDRITADFGVLGSVQLTFE